MKKFIEAMRVLKSTPKELNCKLVWNPNTLYCGGSNWLTTYVFSDKTIISRGLEVVYKQQLISK